MSEPGTVKISGTLFVTACAALSGAIAFAGGWVAVPPGLIAAEVTATVLLLFVLGSFRYRLDKNALTYGSLLIVSASFWTAWWPVSSLKAAVSVEGARVLLPFVRHHFLSFDGLEALIHLDTMLFILGLTFFVAAIAQTRLLETVSFSILRKTNGSMLTTVTLITAIVSFASGILDGVSMIGLLIRVLVILLLLCRAEEKEILFFVVLSTMITTICGMWLAYGEPPNLIMKSNLSPRLTDGFFLRYCLPTALATFGVLFFHMHRRLQGRRVDLAGLEKEIATVGPSHRQAQKGAAISFAPFVALLAGHAVNHDIPLFAASFSGAAVALSAIWRYPEMRSRATTDARHEFSEYLFLFPLFFSIALLMRTGFFDLLSEALHAGIEAFGPSAVAGAQFVGTTFLSAILDNNVVADFASRALRDLPDALLHLFATAQIAGYALGGCWTHIGSAQSIVAFSFIRKEVNSSFTPLDWIRLVTPVISQIAVVAAAIIYAESRLLSVLN